MFRLDAAEYMMSICGDSGLRDLSSPGKSGSIFYLSKDDRFVIKTVNKSELKVCSPFIIVYEHGLVSKTHLKFSLFPITCIGLVRKYS